MSNCTIDVLDKAKAAQCPFPAATKDRAPHPSQFYREGWDRILSHVCRVPHSSRFHRDEWVRSILLAAAILCPAPARAQGCVQCRDNTAATAPATQRAYRHAIILMAGTASVFFLATVALLGKKR